MDQAESALACESPDTALEAMPTPAEPAPPTLATTASAQAEGEGEAGPRGRYPLDTIQPTLLVRERASGRIQFVRNHWIRGITGGHRAQSSLGTQDPEVGHVIERIRAKMTEAEVAQANAWLARRRLEADNADAARAIEGVVAQMVAAAAALRTMATSDSADLRVMANALALRIRTGSAVAARSLADAIDLATMASPTRSPAAKASPTKGRGRKSFSRFPDQGATGVSRFPPPGG